MESLEPLCRHCRHCEPYSFIMGTKWQTENHCLMRVVSFPEPCQSWEREPGADDDLGELRVLVCGGRDFADAAMLDKCLGGLAVSLVIHGGASGADYLAGVWAKGRGIAVQEFPADWKKHGRAAGPIRNKQMLDDGRPDLVVAFPGGIGTANMIQQARKAGVRVIEVS